MTFDVQLKTALLNIHIPEKGRPLKQQIPLDIVLNPNAQAKARFERVYYTLAVWTTSEWRSAGKFVLNWRSTVKKISRGLGKS